MDVINLPITKSKDSNCSKACLFVNYLQGNLNGMTHHISDHFFRCPLKAACRGCLSLVCQTFTIASYCRHLRLPAFSKLKGKKILDIWGKITIIFNSPPTMPLVDNRCKRFYYMHDSVIRLVFSF